MSLTAALGQNASQSDDLASALSTLSMQGQLEDPPVPLDVVDSPIAGTSSVKQENTSNVITRSKRVTTSLSVTSTPAASPKKDTGRTNWTEQEDMRKRAESKKKGK